MRFPLLYEINTRCWLRDLSEAQGRQVSLAEIPDTEFEEWLRLGFTHVWLMGVWRVGAKSRVRALEIDDLRRAYAEALPDWTPQDIGGSPYAIAEYSVEPGLGGEVGLAGFRRKLNSAGLRLMLDFVPNHLALDHPWVSQRPQLFVQMPTAGPGTFAAQTPKGQVNLAFGKDPYSPAWTDTVQLDYRRSESRAAMSGELIKVAGQCDGVRCDMAMLLLNDVFAQTWKDSVSKEQPPRAEFWAEAIQSVKQRHTGFEFLAEVYWGVEERLQNLGFDYTYDKELYDGLVARDGPGVQRHLLGLSQGRLRASAHFLENHDERRVASLLSLPEHRAAALVILGLPGMRFLHEGQLLGYKRRLPVQLSRRAAEMPDASVSAMYEQLLGVLRTSSLATGSAELLAAKKAWEQNPTAQNFILVQWGDANPSFDLVVVNLAPHQGQCYAPVNLRPTNIRNWVVTDLLGSDRFVRPDEDLRKRGLYLDLGAKACQILHFEPQP
jgi:hypothetical protein